MDLIAAALLVLCLAGLVGLPLLVLRSLARSAAAPAVPDGDGWVLRSSPASYYAAAFCMIAPLGVAARLRMGTHETGFSLGDAGPLAGMIFAAFAAAVAAFLAVRARLRTIRYDAGGVTAWGRRHRWEDLVAAGTGRRDARIANPVTGRVRRLPAAATVARFRDGSLVVARADMEGRSEFETFLKAVARRQGLRWGRLED